MSSPLKVGDKVTFWPRGKQSFIDHTATGKIEENITEEKKENGKTIKATAEDPRYLVKNDASDKRRWFKSEMIKSDDD